MPLSLQSDALAGRVAELGSLGIMAHLSFILLLLVGAGLITSCGKKPIVIPISQLTNSTPFQARVESSYFAYQDSNGNPVAIATLTTTDGRRVSVVGSNASMEQIRFVKWLKKGKTYTFPDVFLEHPWPKEEKE